MKERDMALYEMPINKFVESLGAKEPTPGGGGAAALAGALGAALCSMVGNYTTGKKAYAAYEEDVIHMIDASEESAERLLELVQADADEFSKISAAFALPKDDPNRHEAIQEATLAALEPPLEMMREIAKVIGLLEEMCDKGSRMLVSDVGCGASIAQGALVAASLNVYVNTKGLDDREKAAEIEAEVASMIDSCVPRCDLLVREVLGRIRN
jgi:formiminotetrahydrofolate cyclodeaminase